MIAANVLTDIRQPLLLHARHLRAAEPEDLVQDTLLRLLEKPPRASARAAVIAYAKRVMQRLNAEKCSPPPIQIEVRSDGDLDLEAFLHPTSAPGQQVAVFSLIALTKPQQCDRRPA